MPSNPLAWPFPFFRFFARLASAQLACPACGALLVFGNGLKGSGTWDRTTSTIQCSQCQRKFQLGLLAWELNPRPPRGGNPTPKDQRPTIREIAALRAQAGGFWVTNVKKNSEDPVNRFIAGECCCDPLPWRAECPIHGGDRT